MAACASCGRENEANARFCIECGKPLVPGLQSSAAGGASVKQTKGAPPPRPPLVEASPVGAAPGRATPCPHCGGQADPSLPFCPHCGARTAAAPSAGPKSAAAATGRGPKLALLDERGNTKENFVISRGEAIVGRNDGDIRFADDVYLSPVHAQFMLRDGQMFIRDLGSRNGTWLFVEGRHRLSDGDVILVGSQLLRFRRLGYPGPHPPEADKTRRLGSLTPSADIAVLAQLRADGSVRDTFHLSPGRTALIGREKADWLFPYDQTMSATHAEIRSEDSDFVVADAGSRNGIAIAVRGERIVKVGQRIMFGDHVLRVENL